ncbi:pseudouridine synthase [Trueperella pyogenes]
MDATGQLITSPLDIPAGALAHADIQAAAEIDFATLETIAVELGAVKLPVRTLSRVGWFFTGGEAIIDTARARGLSDWRHIGVSESMDAAMEDFNARY